MLNWSVKLYRMILSATTNKWQIRMMHVYLCEMYYVTVFIFLKKPRTSDPAADVLAPQNVKTCIQYIIYIYIYIYKYGPVYII